MSPPSPTVAKLTASISSLMIGHTPPDIREAMALALAGFIVVGGWNEQKAMHHFLEHLATYITRLEEVHP